MAKKKLSTKKRVSAKVSGGKQKRSLLSMKLIAAVVLVLLAVILLDLVDGLLRQTRQPQLPPTAQLQQELNTFKTDTKTSVGNDFGDSTLNAKDLGF